MSGREEREVNSLLYELRTQVQQLSQQNTSLRGRVQFFKTLHEAEARKRTPYGHIPPRIESVYFLNRDGASQKTSSCLTDPEMKEARIQRVKLSMNCTIIDKAGARESPSDIARQHGIPDKRGACRDRTSEKIICRVFHLIQARETLRCRHGFSPARSQ
jgi:hypothetical protein